MLPAAAEPNKRAFLAFVSELLAMVGLPSYLAILFVYLLMDVDDDLYDDMLKTDSSSYNMPTRLLPHELWTATNKNVIVADVVTADLNLINNTQFLLYRIVRDTLAERALK